jgi:hypothetical protein
LVGAPSCARSGTPPCGSIRSTPTNSSAPIFARRPPSEPASSSGRIGSSSWFKIGPESSPSSIRITVTPVRPSPAAIALDGRGPPPSRQQGEVQVDRAERREAERLARQDLAVRDDHDHVGGGLGERRGARTIQDPADLEHRSGVRGRGLRHGRRGQRRAATDLLRRVRDDER